MKNPRRGGGLGLGLPVVEFRGVAESDCEKQSDKCQCEDEDVREGFHRDSR